MADISSSFLYSVLKDVLGLVIGRKARKAKADLASREKWKDKIQDYLYDIRSKELRDDIIIRHVDRYDQYPSAENGKGISPWFKVGLLDLYHNGVMVGLRVSSLVFEESENSWRKASDEESDSAKHCYLVVYMPFRNIVSIDFNGDEYYSFPHFVCAFTCEKMPYEFIRYCEKREFETKRYFFTELEDEEKVRATSLKFGTHNQW